MLKPEHIPDAVWIAMQSVIGDHVSVATQKEAIAAAINVLPGFDVEEFTEPRSGEKHLICTFSIPLPKETEHE